MTHPALTRRRRSTLAVGLALATGALVPTAAHADPAPIPSYTTQIETPAANSVLSFQPDLPGPADFTVSGTAAGAADGALVDVLCVLTGAGETNVFTLATNVEVTAGRFSATASIPWVTCQLIAVPSEVADAHDNSDGLTGVDLSAYRGPRVLGGGMLVTRSDGDGGAQNVFSLRGQGQGYWQAGSLASGGFPRGINFSAAIDGIDHRSLFGRESGGLGVFGGPPPRPRAARSSSGIVGGRVVVDGQAGVPVATSAGNDPLTRESTVDEARTDPLTGDTTIVTTAPIDTVPIGPDDPSDEAFSGVQVQRTSVQDHDGRQLTYTDVLRSVDGRAHEIQAIYSEGVSEPFASTDTAPTAPAYRIPWMTGDDYVARDDGDAITGAPQGTATIGVRGESAGPTAPAAVGSISFDAAPTDGQFLASDAFLVRFVRDLPAGGSTSIAQRFTLGTDDAAPLPAAPASPTPAPAATTPIPASTPAPAVTPPGVGPLPREDLALARLLGSKGQLARLRRTGRVQLTLRDVPSGRYSAKVRRYVRTGPSILAGSTTKASAGDLRLTLRLTPFGRRYLAAKYARRRTSVKVHTEVTWTPVGQALQTSTSRSSMRFR